VDIDESLTVTVWVYPTIIRVSLWDSWGCGWLVGAADDLAWSWRRRWLLECAWRLLPPLLESLPPPSLLSRTRSSRICSSTSRRWRCVLWRRFTSTATTMMKVVTINVPTTAPAINNGIPTEPSGHTRTHALHSTISTRH